MPRPNAWGSVDRRGALASWYRACKWVHVDSADRAGRAASFRWKAHPVVLRTSVTAIERPHAFAFIADGARVPRRASLHASPDARRFRHRGRQPRNPGRHFPVAGPGFLAPRLRAANQAMFEDLAQVAEHGAARQAAPVLTSLARPLHRGDRERTEMTFTTIVIAGAGTMGSQVAWQMAFHGKQVIVYDAIAAGLERAGRFIGRRGAFPSAARRDAGAGRQHPCPAHLHHRPGGSGTGG